MSEKKCSNCEWMEPISEADTKAGVAHCMFDRSIPLIGTTPLMWAHRVVKHGQRCRDFAALIEDIEPAPRRRPSQRN